MSNRALISFVCSVTIKLGDNLSNILQGKFATYDAESLLIIAPSNAVQGGFIQISPSLEGVVSSVWADLFNPDGSIVAVPSASKAIIYLNPLWPSWRIKVPAVVAEDVVYSVFKYAR